MNREEVIAIYEEEVQDATAAKANAHLIAAAPDMYEALGDLLAGFRYIRETYGDIYGVAWDRADEKACAALAKARGEA